MTPTTTYPNPPVRIAAFEVRFPPVDALASEAAVRPLHRELRTTFPFFEPFQVPLGLQIQPDGVVHEVARRVRLSSRTRRTVVSIGADIAIIETSEYRSFEELRAMVWDLMGRIQGLDEILGTSRVGLRYVNEIRIPQVGDDPLGWPPYISEALVAPMRLSSKPLQIMQGAVVYRPEETRGVVLRFGALKGRSVDLGGPLRVPDLGDGPFFLLDIDSYWENPPDELPEFSPQGVVEVLDRLHDAAQDVFEASITDKARAQFGAPGAIGR